MPVAAAESGNATAAPSIHLAGSFYYGDRRLFEDLRLTLAAGQWTCLLGPSGVGKSTLLKLFAGLLAEENHSEGNTDRDPTENAHFNGTIRSSDGGPLRERIAYMAQTDLLFPWLNLRQNVALGQRLRGRTPDWSRAEALMQSVGLAQHASKRPHQLSGGMRQRAALARTLMEDTPIVLLDEPFSALDARTRADMQELTFTALAGKTILLITHDPAEAARLSHHLYLMSAQGLHRHAIANGPPIRAVNDPSTLTAQAELLLALKRCTA